MTKEELQGATGYKLRMVFGGWYFNLYKPHGGKDEWKDIGCIGPFPWPMTHEVKRDIEALGLYDIERELGSRGK